MGRKANQSWIVKVKCTIEKEIVTTPCSWKTANEDPFKALYDERELCMTDWEVLSVEPNE